MRTEPSSPLTAPELEWLKYVVSDLTLDFFPKPISIINTGIIRDTTTRALRAGAENAQIISIGTKATRSDAYDPIHFLFIDDCQREHTVVAYINSWSPLVVRGGIMAFHDYNPNVRNLDIFSDFTSIRNAIDDWYATANDWEHCDSCDSIIAFKRTARRISIPLFSQVEAQWQRQPAPV